MTLEMVLDDDIAEIGGRFTGRIMRDADADGVTEDSRARGVRLSLRYRTEGRGDTDTQVVAKAEFDLEPPGGLHGHFELSVPTTSPVSYDGSLIRVVWEIEARIDLRRARDPKMERSVLVVPTGGRGVYDRPHPLPNPALHYS